MIISISDFLEQLINNNIVHLDMTKDEKHHLDIVFPTYLGAGQIMQLYSFGTIYDFLAIDYSVDTIYDAYIDVIRSP